MVGAAAWDVQIRLVLVALALVGKEVDGGGDVGGGGEEVEKKGEERGERRGWGGEEE